MCLISVRLVLARVPAYWLGIAFATLLVLAAMTIIGRYTLRIRSSPLDIELTPGPMSPMEPVSVDRSR